jgi:uncharacterized membrane protein YhaH (DUF805 family)
VWGMRGFIEQYSTRREYRFASAVLIVGCVAPMLLLLAIAETRGWAGAAFAVSLLFYLALFALTYFRLRNVHISTWWVLLMLVVFPFGPQWKVAAWEWGSLSITPSGLIPLAPVVVGWFAGRSRGRER